MEDRQNLIQQFLSQDFFAIYSKEPKKHVKATEDFLSSPTERLSDFMRLVSDQIEKKPEPTFLGLANLTEATSNCTLSIDQFGSSSEMKIFGPITRQKKARVALLRDEVYDPSEESESHLQAAEKKAARKRSAPENIEGNQENQRMDRIRKNIRYDFTKELVTKFERSEQISLDTQKIKSHRSHTWLYAKIAGFGKPQLQKYKSKFIDYLSNNYQQQIPKRFPNFTSEEREVLLEFMRDTIGAVKMCLNGDVQQSLALIYKRNKTNNRLARENMQSCLKKYKEILEQASNL